MLREVTVITSVFISTCIFLIKLHTCSNPRSPPILMMYSYCWSIWIITLNVNNGFIQLERLFFEKAEVTGNIDKSPQMLTRQVAKVGTKRLLSGA
jgi:hypothetical protein